ARGESSAANAGELPRAGDGAGVPSSRGTARGRVPDTRRFLLPPFLGRDPRGNTQAAAPDRERHLPAGRDTDPDTEVARTSAREALACLRRAVDRGQRFCPRI